MEKLYVDLPMELARDAEDWCLDNWGYIQAQTFTDVGQMKTFKRFYFNVGERATIFALKWSK